MPRELTLEDGSTVEVPTEEELTELKASVEAKTTLEAKVAELEADPQNRNWKEARETISSLKDKIKTLETTPPAGDPPKTDPPAGDPPPAAVTQEDVVTAATTAARAELLAQHKDSLLSTLGEEDRKVVDHYYNKLAAGESLDIAGVNKTVEEALKLASTDEKPLTQTSSAGLPPRVDADAKSKFTDTEQGKGLAKEVFGIEEGTK